MNKKTGFIKRNKADVFKDFFCSYAGDIEGQLNDMDKSALADYLNGDIFIGVASAATGIPECEFVEYAMENAGKLSHL